MSTILSQRPQPRGARLVLAELAGWALSRPAMVGATACLWGVAAMAGTLYAAMPYPGPGQHGLVTALGALAGISSVLACRSERPRSRKSWVGVTLGGALLGVVVMWLVWVGGASQIRKASQDQFDVERAAFEGDPRAFGDLSKTAKREWGVDVELGDAEHSWIQTTENGAGTSPATMEVLPGWCLLSLSPSAAARFPAGRLTGRDAAWVAAVHEIGHCLDVGHDAGEPLTGSMAGTASIAPIDTLTVHDAHSYYLAESKPATKFWRERYADAFMVGWARLARPADAARLAGAWRDTRIQRAGVDPTHATACTIEAALTARPPASLRELPAWAEQIRAISCLG